MKRLIVVLAALVAVLSVGVSASNAESSGKLSLSSALNKATARAIGKTVGAGLPLRGSSQKSPTPYTLVGGGGGDCSAGGNLVDGSPKYMEAYAYIICPSSPQTYVTAYICLEKYLYGSTWEHEGCVANQGWGDTEAVTEHVCQYTTWEYEYIADGLVTLSGPGYYDSETAKSPVAFAKCWMS